MAGARVAGLRRAVALAVLLLATWGGPLPAQRAAPVKPPALEIRFLDVGQGDAVLLRSGRRTALIDTGPSDAVVARLRALGVDTIDLLVASHNHSDHIGGSDAVLDAFPVRFYLDNGFPATTRIQQRVLERVERKKVVYLAPTRRTIELGSASLSILPPPPLPEEQGQNNHSVPILVREGGFLALLSGDSEAEEINALLARDSIPDVDLLKAAHHGSRNGVTPAWLARTRPEVVVISVGAGNGYGHPHAAALRLYCAGKRRVYRTDRNGEVTVKVAAEGGYGVTLARPAAAGCG